jgi:hypothetical protein
MSHLCYCIYKGAHIAFVLFVFIGAHVAFVICICRGVHVAFVLFVFAEELISHLCYLYL